MNHTATYLAWRSLSALSRTALILAALAAAILLWMTPSMLTAMFAGSLAVEDEPLPTESPEVLAYVESVKAHREFASLRSPFFEPVAPAKPLPPQPSFTPDRSTPPARAYGGPKLVGFAGNQAMFASAVYKDEPFIAVGQQGGVLELVAIEQPWKAKVRWSGAEFDLNLFDRLEMNPIVNFGVPLGGSPASTGTDIFGSGAPAATLQLDTSAGDAAAEADDN